MTPKEIIADICMTYITASASKRTGWEKWDVQSTWIGFGNTKMATGWLLSLLRKSLCIVYVI